MAVNIPDCGYGSVVVTWDRPVAYLLKWPDSVATGWPGCLQAIAVVALLVWEATKLNLGQDLMIKVLDCGNCQVANYWYWRSWYPLW
uniref:Uncharacterized protein n=1 Tax=Capra hircus TaxID=9925 RepID=A0A8C2XYN3_CAPHI